MKHIKYILPIYFIIISGHISSVHARDESSVRSERVAKVKQEVFPLLIQDLGGLFNFKDLDEKGMINPILDAFSELTKKQQKEFLSTYDFNITADFKSIIEKKLDFRFKTIFNWLKLAEKTPDDKKIDDKKLSKLMRDILDIPSSEITQSTIIDFVMLLLQEQKNPNMSIEDATKHFLSLNKEDKLAFLRKVKRDISLKIHPDKVSENMELANNAITKFNNLYDYTYQYFDNL